VERKKSDDTFRTRSGTAFFVTKTHLLTAGHNVKCSSDAEIKSIRLSYAGCKKVDYDTNTVECNLIGTLYDSGSKIDLAILDSPSQNVGTWLPISAKIADLPIGAIVDIIGYPGRMPTAQKESFQKDGSLKDYNESMKEVEIMLPPKTLTVSRGVVEAIENGCIRYKLSTLCGMSGACLMYDGKIYGFSIYVNAHDRGACRCMQGGK
jgi:V8-like Glu-specific endopeptidase